MPIKNNQIIFIVGPTGVGKSDVGLLLAQHIGGEIIACDAMQVYKEIAIASDKPTVEQRSAVAHHCLDLVSVTEDFNVAQYAKAALAAIADVRKRGKVPILLGGSGMYMAVLLDGIFEDNIKDNELRESLEHEAKADGAALHERLTQLDPQSAANIHPNNVKRVIRALEVVMLTGQPLSAMQQKRSGLWGKEDVKIFGLNRPREILYERVDARVDRMFAQGLVDEIKKVIELPLSVTAAGMIGVVQVGGYLNEQYSLDHAVTIMKRDTRHYVKRQLTWFNREKRLQWIEIGPKDTPQSIVNQIIGQL